MGIGINNFSYQDYSQKAEFLPWKMGNHSQATAKPEAASEPSFWGEDGFSFDDLVDIVNPLHHIPVVSDIYSSMTGDTKSTGSDIAGSAVFGGLLGFAFSVVDSIVEDGTGSSVNEHLISLFDGDTEPKPQNDNVLRASSHEQNNRASAAIAPQWENPDLENNSARNTQADNVTKAYKKVQKFDTLNLPDTITNRYNYIA